MAFAADIAGDYALIDGGESVTLRRINGDGANAITVTNATNAPLSHRQMAVLGGGIDGRERSWSLNATEVGSAGIAPGDQIVDAANRIWVVISAERLTLSNRWRVVTRLQE